MSQDELINTYTQNITNEINIEIEHTLTTNGWSMVSGVSVAAWETWAHLKFARGGGTPDRDHATKHLVVLDSTASSAEGWPPFQLWPCRQFFHFFDSGNAKWQWQRLDCMWLHALHAQTRWMCMRGFVSSLQNIQGHRHYVWGLQKMGLKHTSLCGCHKLRRAELEKVRLDCGQKTKKDASV